MDSLTKDNKSWNQVGIKDVVFKIDTCGLDTEYVDDCPVVTCGCVCYQC